VNMGTETVHQGGTLPCDLCRITWIEDERVDPLDRASLFGPEKKFDILHPEECHGNFIYCESSDRVLKNRVCFAGCLVL
jgi:hypothetical protein